jgi:hypothetical protein
MILSLNFFAIDDSAYIYPLLHDRITVFYIIFTTALVPTFSSFKNALLIFRTVGDSISLTIAMYILQFDHLPTFV